jgi:hypothetical protein
MPFTPKERAVIAKLGEMYRTPPYSRSATIPELLRIAVRLDAESRRQRRSIKHLKEKLSRILGD